MSPHGDQMYHRSDEMTAYTTVPYVELRFKILKGRQSCNKRWYFKYYNFVSLTKQTIIVLILTPS